MIYFSRIRPGSADVASNGGRRVVATLGYVGHRRADRRPGRGAEPAEDVSETGRGSIG